MRINIDAIKNKAGERPEGYVEDVLSKGVIVGNFLEIQPLVYKRLLEKYAPHTPMPPSKCCNQMPPLATQLKNVVGAAGRVVEASLRGQGVLADPQTVERRQSVCSGCEFWVAEKKRCSVCGCRTEYKLRLLTEKCPKGKW